MSHGRPLSTRSCTRVARMLAFVYVRERPSRRERRGIKSDTDCRLSRGNSALAGTVDEEEEEERGKVRGEVAFAQVVEELLLLALDT